MPRAPALVAAWLVAAALVTAVTWQGVTLIGDRVAGTVPVPLRPTELGAPPPAAGSPTTGTSAGAAAPPPTSGGAAVPTAPPATAPVVPSGVRPSPPPGGSPAPPPGSTPAPAPTAAPRAGSPTTTTTAAGEPAVTRTYTMVGGSAAVRFAPEGVTLLWATPNAGFSAEVEREGGTIRVEFESESHRSRLEAWWDAGPRDRVREESHGDDGLD